LNRKKKFLNFLLTNVSGFFTMVFEKSNGLKEVVPEKAPDQLLPEVN